MKQLAIVLTIALTAVWIAVQTGNSNSVEVVASADAYTEADDQPQAQQSASVTLAERPLAKRLPRLSALPERNWVVGSRYVYDVRTQAAVAVDTDRSQLQRGLSGRLELVVAEHDDSLVHVLGRFEGRAWQHPADGVAETGLDRPFVATFNRDGRFEALHVNADTTSRARRFLADALAGLQITRNAAPTAAAWEVEEHDTTGDYTAEYNRTGEQSLTRTKVEYLRVLTKDGLRAAKQVGRYVVDAKSSIALDDEGWPANVSSKDGMTVTLGETGISFTASATFQQVAANRVAAPSIDWAALRTGAVATPRDRAAVRRNMDRNMVDGRSFTQLHNDIARLVAQADEEGDKALPQAVARVASLIRLNPQVVAEVADAARRASNPREALSMTASLGLAGTAAAQVGLTGLVADADVDASTRDGAAIALATTGNASAATLEALQNVATEDDTMAESATLALGGAVKNAAEDVDTTDAVDRLIQAFAKATTSEERVLALRALGNTGDVRAVDSILAGLADADGRVRLTAIGALRFIPGSNIDKTLATYLKVGDEPTRIAALQSIGFRTITADTWGAVLMERLTNDPSDKVRRGCGQLLEPLAAEDPTVAAALAEYVQ